MTYKYGHINVYLKAKTKFKEAVLDNHEIRFEYVLNFNSILGKIWSILAIF